MANEILPPEEEALIRALKAIGGGNLLAKAAEDMQLAVKSAMIDGGSTSVTIKLEFKKATEEAMSIKGASKATVQIKKPAAMFFVTDTYLPSRERPNQQLMQFERN